MHPEGLVTLVATRPDMALLCSRALPAIRAQIKAPTIVLVVFDQRPPSEQEREEITHQLAPLRVKVLCNTQLPGAAGAWNTGIAWAIRQLPNSYVAILDDDDHWDSKHLQCCWQTAEDHAWPDIVLSGLRVRIGNQTANSEPITSISQHDFLVGNPGWQGSNTFVKTKALREIGGFTPGLVSCNDRDLAIRLLDSPSRTMAYTSRFTATWYGAEKATALSAFGSAQKLAGLAQFYDRYQSRMTTHQQRLFFDRAAKVFGIDEATILAKIMTE